MIAARLRRKARELALCVSFYTRLPLPEPRHQPAPRHFARAQWAAPIAGLVVGLIGALIYAIATALGLPALPAATLTVAACMLLTGCLHEDGLSDTADGFGGGANRERKLEIMRDSRLGTYGAAALLVSVLLRCTCLAAIGAPLAVAAALIAAHVASRALIPAFMRLVPPARRDGLAAAAGVPPGRTVLAALLIGGLALPLLGLVKALAAAVLLLVLFLVLARLCRRQIGGATGDVIGALQQSAEIAVLLVAAATA